MKASELRVGNYLQYHDGINFIVTHHDIKIIAEWTSKIAPLPNPIPLTEEWLLKFGFKKRDDGTSEDWYIGMNPVTHDWLFDIKWIKGYEYPFYRNGHFPIKSVNQLQNLYFALTETELTINQPTP